MPEWSDFFFSKIMELHHELADGSIRPNWAGPVTVLSRRRGRPGHASQAIEVSGVVVPVQVHPRYLPVGSVHQHTFGLGLGFPDLSEHLLDPSHNPGLSKNWAKMERAIAEAAAKTMGWNGSLHPQRAGLAGLPPNALHLRLTGDVPRGKNRDEQKGSEEPDSLTGELTKVYPIRDVSHTMLRMQTVGSPSSFRLTPMSGSWSRDPRAL